MSRLTTFARKILCLPPSVPTQVDIEIATVCNLHCKMCKRETIDFGNQLVPYETVVQRIDLLPKGVEHVSFGGYGEPLMHPRFNDIARYAKSKGFTVETTSNGTLLATDERMIALLDGGLDSLRISVDHVRPPTEEHDVGHVFSERLLKDLKRLAELRRERGSPMRLGINVVVHQGNAEEILDIIRYADGIGFELVELIRLDTCANHAQRTLQYEREKAIYEQVERMDRRIEVITPANRFTGRRALYNIRQDFCPFRFQSAHIRMNGAVTPCAFGFAAHDFGNIHEQGLLAIWRGKGMRDVRRDDRNPTCESCSIFKWGTSARDEPKKSLPVVQ